MRALIAALMMAAGATALAQPSPETMPVQRADFVNLDRNRDGYISKIEALADAEIQKRLATFDVDKDGRLSEAEYAMAKDDIAKRVLVDSAITARVKAALLAEKGIPSMSISVETYEGRVQLSGFVGSPELASRAGRVTASVSGVRTVHNNISVK
jgi:osmotically-inducible protein OsmY